MALGKFATRRGLSERLENYSTIEERLCPFIVLWETFERERVGTNFVEWFLVYRPLYMCAKCKIISTQWELTLGYPHRGINLVAENKGFSRNSGSNVYQHIHN